MVGRGAASPPPFSDVLHRQLAATEQEGFEPPVPFGTTVFKTVALNHSATAPKCLLRITRAIRVRDSFRHTPPEA